ncbi:MAG: translation initiation factor 2 subunit 1 [Candidatus Woesearchaeota archaeon]|jgi:translation initiation factor 2 subunit 1
MLFNNKKGFPQEGEIVVCTVTKIHHHSVFVTVDAYSRSAMLHISEVSPGRIRNLREFVKEGKTIICKVLSCDQEKGHVDVSLRRVSEGQRIATLGQMNKEVKAEKIIEAFCADNKLDLKKTYAALVEILAKDNYQFIHKAFDDFVQKKYELTNTGLDPELHAKLHEIVLQRIKPPKVEILAKFKITCFDGESLDVIKTTFAKAIAIDTENLVVQYGGGGIYNIRIVCGEFKSAEKILKEVVSIVSDEFEQNKNCTYDYTRSEGKQLS